jgi:hypothetical protein
VEQDGWTLLSALEEDLCLHETPEGFVLHEIDASGAVVDRVEYSPGELGPAATEITRRLFDHHELPRPVSAMTAAINAHDVAAARACIADDCVFEDHRQLRVVELRTPDEHLEAMRSVMALAPDYAVLTRRVFALEEWGHVLLTGSLGTTTGGGPFEVPVIAVGTWDKRGLQKLTAVFDPDDVDAAIARLREVAP